jgi:hypothetical protein
MRISSNVAPLEISNELESSRIDAFVCEALGVSQVVGDRLLQYCSELPPTTTGSKPPTITGT